MGKRDWCSERTISTEPLFRSLNARRMIAQTMSARLAKASPLDVARQPPRSRRWPGRPTTCPIAEPCLSAAVLEELDTLEGREGGAEWQVLQHVVCEASFESKESGESRSGIGSRGSIVAGGRRIRDSRWSGRRQANVRDFFLTESNYRWRVLRPCIGLRQ
jgi:hypothetical protein